MTSPAPRRVVLAGAGIAGLTAALAFARTDARVALFERSPSLRDIGAGLQLSPNATRILRRLGVLDHLDGAVRPPAVLLRDAASLREIARVPLGAAGEQRWGAPYLVVHRADLQRALLSAIAERPEIELTTGATITAVPQTAGSARVALELPQARPRTVEADLAVAADGVWSVLRRTLAGGTAARFVGRVAWRRTIPADMAALRALTPDMAVGAFLSPRFHLVCYPIRDGREINLVAFTPGGRVAEDWSVAADPTPLVAALASCAPVLAELAQDGTGWTAHPLHVVEPGRRWTAGRLALIGDAAHALTPFAAQGAAMAIEDAATLATATAGSSDRSLELALSDWETARKRRVARVRRRGALNGLAWHAAGPVATARNLILASMRAEKLAADLDWLYGWNDDPSRG